MERKIQQSIKLQSQQRRRKISRSYLGNTTGWENQNWDNLLVKVKGLLNKWSQYVKLTSYQGRKIICNQIVGSLSIHTLSVLHPPRSFTQDVQREINKFIWQGIHWLRPNYLYTAQEKGGQDLINLEAKIGVLRLNLANKIQQNLRSSSLSFLSHLYNLSLYGNISPHHFFCYRREETHC